MCCILLSLQKLLGIQDLYLLPSRLWDFLMDPFGCLPVADCHGRQICTQMISFYFIYISGKAVSNRPLWSGPSPDPCIAGALPFYFLMGYTGIVVIRLRVNHVKLGECCWFLTSYCMLLVKQLKQNLVHVIVLQDPPPHFVVSIRQPECMFFFFFYFLRR